MNYPCDICGVDVELVDFFKSKNTYIPPVCSEMMILKYSKDSGGHAMREAYNIRMCNSCADAILSSVKTKVAWNTKYLMKAYPKKEEVTDEN